MATSLENQYIDESYQKLTQISGSVLADGTGSAIENLTVTASLASTASFIQTAQTASFVSASNIQGVITSASYAISSSRADSAHESDSATSASRATSAASADTVTSASYAATASILLGSVESASYAPTNVNDANTYTATQTFNATTTFNNTATFDGALNQDASLASNYFEGSVDFRNDTTFTGSVDINGAVTATSFSGDGSSVTGVISASHAVQADASEDADDLIIPVKNDFGSTIAKGTPVYAKGVQGDQILVAPASASDSTRMPAIAILNEELTANAGGQAIVSGRIIGVNTLGFTAGRTVYVAADGGYTQTKPTGSNLIQNLGVVGKVNETEGEGVIIGSGRSNDVPNISTGQLWVGNDDQVATATNTSSLFVSHSVSADTASFLPSDTNLNINQITASTATFTSASIGYLESITGSAKIIGDAFIELNNDTPVQRYAGIKVVDSGSNNTSSLFFDGQTNDWNYQYEGTDPTDFGVVLFGPEYSTQGSPTYNTNNRLVKGDGGHHINDSSITDDGTTVSTDIPISASAGFTGSLHGTALTASYVETAQTASFITSSNIQGAITSASHALNADDAISASYAPTNTADNIDFTGEIHFQGDVQFSGSVNGDVNALTISSNTASMDLSTGNFFTLTVVSGSNTHLNSSNIQKGQTISLKVLQPAGGTGTMTFDSEFKFAAGTAPTITSAAASEDILTFVTFDTSNIYSTAVQNLS